MTLFGYGLVRCTDDVCARSAGGEWRSDSDVTAHTLAALHRVCGQAQKAEDLSWQDRRRRNGDCTGPRPTATHRDTGMRNPNCRRRGPRRHGRTLELRPRRCDRAEVREARQFRKRPVENPATARALTSRSEHCNPARRGMSLVRGPARLWRAGARARRLCLSDRGQDTARDHAAGRDIYHHSQADNGSFVTATDW